MSIIPGIFHNVILVSAIVAWLTAQVLKVLVSFVVLKKVDIELLLSSGGFPSSHSATVCALSLGIGKYYGWDDPIFAVAAIFGMIVMYDATGVRQAAGKQAEVINKLVESLYQGSDLAQERLKELIGHTPFEVFGGAIVGIAVGLLM